jgi:hypothetical protein
VCVIIMVNHPNTCIPLTTVHPLPLFLPTYLPLSVSRRHRIMFLDSVTAPQSQRAGSQPSTSSDDITHLDSPHSAWRGVEVDATLSDKVARSVAFVSPPSSVPDQDERLVSVTVEGPMTLNASDIE